MHAPLWRVWITSSKEWGAGRGSDLIRIPIRLSGRNKVSRGILNCLDTLFFLSDMVDLASLAHVQRHVLQPSGSAQTTIRRVRPREQADTAVDKPEKNDNGGILCVRTEVVRDRGEANLSWSDSNFYRTRMDPFKAMIALLAFLCSSAPIPLPVSTHI